MTFEQFRNKIHIELERWFRLQAMDPTRSFYAYYKPSYVEGQPYQDSDMLIRSSDDKPGAGWKLMRTERVDGFATLQTNYYQLVETARSLPILSPQL